MHVSQGAGFLIDASVDLDDYLITGEFSAPDGDGVRWLLSLAWVERRRPDLLPSEGWAVDDEDQFMPTHVEARRPDVWPSSGGTGGASGRGFPPEAVAGQWLDISGAVAQWQERLRAADPAALRPWERWVAALPVEGHSESEGVSVVGFTWSPGSPLGWRWAWGRRRSPRDDLLSVVVDDLAHDLASGGVTKPDQEGIRWLLPFEESLKPPVPWATPAAGAVSNGR
jgi:hypothetical protein